MESWESVQATLESIEGSLKESIDIGRLADVAHLSPYYYQKLFHRLVGKSVMEYVKLRRLARVADRLGLDGGKILDLALEYGFQNHETMTRSFKETYGMTPEAYRSNPVFLSHFIVPDLSLKYRLIDEGVPLVSNGIVLEVKHAAMEKGTLFAGASVQNPVNDTPGVDLLGELWRQYHTSFGSSIPRRVEGGRETGISSPGNTPGCFTYFTGAEVHEHSDEWLRDAGDGLTHENRELPVGEYVVCTFSAENFHSLTTMALNKAIGYLFETWIPAHRLQCEGVLAEIYDRRCLGVDEGPEMEVMVRLKAE